MEAVKKISKTDLLLDKLRDVSSSMTRMEQVNLALRLAIPAIMAQLSHILMEYIDASMVGRLGAADSASIGLVSTTTWLFWGLCGSIATGFSVQVAHRIGASDAKDARSILRQAFLTCLAISLFFCVIGVSICKVLPTWLGGGEEIHAQATNYFFIFALTLPFFELNYMMSSMLRCSGNVKVPSMLNILMCFLDVLFNFLFIFPTTQYHFIGMKFTIYGAGLGVMGAALGTTTAEVIVSGLLFYFLCYRSPQMRIFGKYKYESKGLKSYIPTSRVLKKAIKIGMPIGCERVIMCGAQICTTVIVAPLGMFAIAANSFGINAESLCYMPGYGIADAATTLVGQSVGAQRKDLAKSFANITVVMGVLIMTFMGAVMYVAAPFMMQIMSPVQQIVDLGTEALRIEAFAEPMYAASIVCYGVFVGAGKTIIPSSMNLGSIWLFRIPLALLLVSSMGLNGVWLAMCIELNIRGIIFLIRLKSNKWIPKIREPK